MNKTVKKLLLLWLLHLGYLKGFHGSDYTETDYLLDEADLDAIDISYGYILDSDIKEISNNSKNNESKVVSNNDNKNNSFVSSQDPFIGTSEVNYLLNDTQQHENATESLYGHILTSDVIENNNSTNNTSHFLNRNNNFVDSPLDPLIKIALIALMLHILIIGGGVVIYLIVCCGQCSLHRRNRPVEVTHRMQSPLTLKHVPNIPNCPCHGCRVARQILNGLIVQKILAERSEC